MISDRQQPLPPLAVSPGEWGRPLVAYRTEALPRVFWAGSWTVADDHHAAEKMLEAVQGDRAVLPAAIPGLTPGAPEGSVAAHSLRLGPDWLEAAIEAPSDGLLVVLDPFYPGWSATVDGRPAPLLRADFAFQAVPVSAGHHSLRLEYHNRLVPLGAAMAAGGLLALVAALSWGRRSRLRGRS